MSAVGSPAEHASTETYLRLRAEAELRRVLALPRDDATNDDEAEELTAEHGLRRHSVVAQALAQAGAIDRGVADSVTEELAAALFARSWVGASDMADVLRPERHGQPASPPAGVCATPRAGPCAGGVLTTSGSRLTVPGRPPAPTTAGTPTPCTRIPAPATAMGTGPAC